MSPGHPARSIEAVINRIVAQFHVDAVETILENLPDIQLQDAYMNSRFERTRAAYCLGLAIGRRLK